MKIPGYKLHRQIGKGGMATVFLATQLSFERKVALKLIADSAFGTSELAERFQHEAKIVARLSHPHIVPVYDVGRVEQIHFLAMDYLPGGDLNSFIRAGLEPAEAVKILSQLAQALHFAHSKGYIHRDVKPDNILFREDNSAVLTDFGIARAINAEQSLTSNSGLVFGTPAYMSPEQSQNKATDGRSDLYSLGVIFYKMLTRQQPFNADSPRALAIKHIKEPVPRLPRQLSAYQPVIDQLLAKNPDDRFQSGLALSKALAAIDSFTHVAVKAESQAVTSRETMSLQLVESSDNSQKKNLVVEESSYRKLGLAKRYIFRCQLSSDDVQQFNILFSQFTSRLLSWHQQHKKHCEQIQLDITIVESILPRALQLIERLRSGDESDSFKFLEKIQLEIHIRNFQNKTIKLLKA
jgi:serine/threonine protein kinase